MAERGELSLEPSGPFSLERAATFGFGPVDPAPFDGTMRLAFATDDGRGHAGVLLRQDPDGTVRGEVRSVRADPAGVRAQVARILSLDHDGEAWLEAGGRDPVLGRLQAAHPGLRPVLFHSPYEGAAWAVLSARRQARQAAAVRRRLAEAHGAVFELAGERLAAFPQPEALLAIEAPEAGLEGVRLERLHAVARAALEGRLTAAHLQALGPEAATEELLTLPGIGPFYAGLIVVRATGFADALPTAEPRVLAAAARAYGLGEPPGLDAFARMAEPWRPFRTWACVLLRASAAGA